MSSVDSATIKLSIVNEKHITTTINPYDYYNNRFLNGPNGQQSENQTEKPVKECVQNRKFLPHDTGDEGETSLKIRKSDISSKEVSRNPLSQYELNFQVGLLQSNLAQTNDTGKSIQDGYKPICIPLKVDGVVQLVPFEEHCLHQGHTECYMDISKWVLTGEAPLGNFGQDDTSDYTGHQKIEREAIVDLAANKHNHWNREIHDCLWCPFILFFMFFCCIPALLLMRQSDIAFQTGRDSTARLYARCSSLFYGIGLVLSLALYAMIVTLVVVFTN